MSAIGIIDGCALLASLAGGLIVWKGWRKDSCNFDTKSVLVFLLIFMFLHNLSNFLEWNGISSTLDQLSDYVGMTLPIFWGAMIYVFLQNIMTEQLRRERDNAKNYLDIVGVVIIALDKDQRVLMVNKKGCEILGYLEQEILGQKWINSFVPGRERHSYQMLFQKLISVSGAMELVNEHYVLTKAGKERLIRWTHKMLRDAKGHTIGTLSAGEDITNIRIIEETLSKTKAHERALIDTLPHLAWVKDIEGRFILVNRAFATACGHDFRQIIGKTDLDVWPRVLAEKYRADDSAVMKTRKAKFTVEQIANTSGVRWAETFKSPILDQEGRVIGTTGIALDITERKNEEENLRQSEKRLRQIIDLVPHFIFAKNRLGQFILANKAVAEAYGTTVEKLLGKTDANFNSDQAEVSHFLKDDNDVIDRGQPKEIFEEKITDAEGKVRVLHTFKIPFSQAATGYDAVLGVSTDITERKRAENSLRESARMLREAQSIAGLGSYVLDISTGFWKSSQVLDDILGIDEKYVRSVEGWENLIHAKWREQMSDYFKTEVLGKRGRFDKVYKIIRNTDGQERWVHGLGELEFDNEQRPIWMLGTIQDITIRKQSEEALQKSEEKYRTIIETGTDAIFIADAKTGEIIDANKNADELLGLPHDKIIGMNFIEIHPKGETQHYREQFFAHKEKIGVPWSRMIGFVYNRQKGKIPVQINAVEIELQGRIVNIGIFRDITELKIIEDALRKDKDGLEKKVLEKTEILGKTLKELDDAKRLSDIGSLAATVAHELRNPLGVIKTAVYNIKQKQKDDSLKSHLNNIDKKIGESEMIIKNLLSYAQIKAPTYEKVNVLEVLNECLENCRHKFADIQAEVSVHHQEEQPTLMAEVNGLHLNEMFSNIMDNAYQALSDHRGKITIDLSYNDPKGFFQVVIRDDGSGIEKEILSNIFDPFFTTKARGTGLGLSICNQIVNLYNGSIDIQSVKGQGTSVTLSLPIRKKG